MKPLKHQRKFVRGYKGPMILGHEGGTGKTVCGCLWLRDGRDDDALVICPAKVARKWLQALSDWGTQATVMTEKQFKESEDREWSAIVVDEADDFASPLFQAKKRSQLSTKLYGLVKSFEDVPVLLLTATPVRSTPWNLHTLLCFTGNFIPVKVWRDKYFYLQLPDEGRYRFLTRAAYMMKPEWRKLIQKDLERYADIVLLKDVDELPPVTTSIIKVKTPKYVMQQEDKIFYSEHRWEQTKKLPEILAAGREFRKVMVVVFYKEQIESIAKSLRRDGSKEVFILQGGVRDPESVIEAAAASSDCYFIVQSSVGVGFDGDTFSCLVFASMGFPVKDWVQMKFRVRRVNNLHPVDIRYLIGGRCDEAIYKNLQAGRDFVPSEWRS